MKRQSILKDNKGASLVMVLVAMFFVGIIAAIVLTITVGNAKSTKATVDTSENFYTSESVLDDFKMFLKKVATSAATEAYGATLADFSSEPEKMLPEYKKKFKEEFIKALKNDSSTGIFDIHADGDTENLTKMILDSDFVKNQISFDRPGNITIKYDINTFSDASTEYPTLKGVEITYKDESGYESKITLNIVMRAQLPTTKTDPFLGSFDHEIDHFVMIAGGSINPSDSKIAGDFTGGIYTKGNFNVKTKTPVTDATCLDTDWVNIRAQYLLVGNDINVRGRMTVAPIADSNVIYKGSGTKIGSEVWCDDISLLATDAIVKTDRKADPDDSSNYLNTDVYLKGNLELNGKSAEYAAVGGKLMAYSEESDVTKTGEAPKSSAIILNGLGAKLDLSQLGSLEIAGKAYTALPTLDGIDASYKFYNGETDTLPSGTSFYTQGESVTYRAVQSLYLIPGDYISGIGHNPMKKSEFSSITSASINPPKDVFGEAGTGSYLLNSNKFKSHEVRYLNGENYVYLFWDFKSTDAAVEYFNKVTKHGSGEDGRYYDLVLKQLGMLDLNSGYMKLPSNTKATGNIIKYDSSNKFGKITANTSGIDDKSGDYSSYMSAFDPETVFEGFKAKEDGALSHPAARSFSGTIQGPLTYQEKNKTMHTSDNVVGPARAKSTTYYLMTGENVTVNEIKSGYTYIIITPGNVTFASGCSGDFRGMIIAGGNITLPARMNMECLGMLKYTPLINNKAKDDVDTTELQALLSVVYDDSDGNNGNTRLREIFGLRDTSLDIGGDYDGELVKMDIEEFLRN